MGKAARDQSARDRVKAQREEQRQKERMRRMVTIVAAVVVALAAVGAGWWVAAKGSESEQVTTAMAKAGVEKPVLDVYEDFQCPACKALEETSGATIKNLAAEGKAKVVYHPITIFTTPVTRGNSVRAAAAARCIPGGTPWSTYHDRLFKEQPSETTEGFKINDLVAWGKEAGVTAPNFEKCVTSQEKAPEHIAYSTKILDTQKLKGTPTLKLNGTELGEDVAFKPASLRQAILDAAK
jgi:protein-disulfide isomerase